LFFEDPAILGGEARFTKGSKVKDDRNPKQSFVCETLAIK
jgi:hypothetical protein